MKVLRFGRFIFTILCTAIVSSPTFGGPPDAELVKVANWLVGAFVEKPSGATVGTTNSELGKTTSLMIRALQDPVVFGDGLYTYVQFTTQTGETPHIWQRVFRLKKSGSRVRVEVLRIDGRVVSMLSSDAQMLSNLAPADLIKEKGCDMTLEARGDVYVGTTDPRVCGADDKEPVERHAGIEVSKDRIILLRREGDATGVRRYEFLRTPIQ